MKRTTVSVRSHSWSRFGADPSLFIAGPFLCCSWRPTQSGHATVRLANCRVGVGVRLRDHHRETDGGQRWGTYVGQRRREGTPSETHQMTA
ncbi:hypothetical protein CYMTET_27741 [Cymbomonas tetramitiformis]|uniref:Uncharacterized protein n=1 Tax=Cymbomonas tetramitiformis TaxID=36881 RepID=A0AAE0FP63_9CHLO|nr:hypothetical protein CYMTET_27741 [Cymbomonas tetramitiformis]